MLTKEQIATLRKNKGGTFAVANPVSLQLPTMILVDAAPYVTEGYWVATDSIFAPQPDRYLDNEEFLSTLERLISNCSDSLIGFWCDNGHWYVDQVRHYYRLDNAISTAVAYDQLAVWDIANNREILIDNDNENESKQLRYIVG